jgi:hypothetical protein
VIGDEIKSTKAARFNLAVQFHEKTVIFFFFSILKNDEKKQKKASEEIIYFLFCFFIFYVVSNFLQSLFTFFHCFLV